MYKKGSIELTASTELDIALLPEIQAMSKPQFPDCRNKIEETVVEIECKISDDKEKYNVTWNSDITFTKLEPGKHNSLPFLHQCKQCNGNIYIFYTLDDNQFSYYCIL